MNPRIRSRMPASIGSNQASPANKDAACAACVVVLSSPMAWSPPARQRRSWLVGQAGDYAPIQFHHLRDGTGFGVTAHSFDTDQVAAHEKAMWNRCASISEAT